MYLYVAYSKKTEPEKEKQNCCFEYLEYYSKNCKASL